MNEKAFAERRVTMRRRPQDFLRNVEEHTMTRSRTGNDTRSLSTSLTIGELSRRFGVSLRTLRFYEEVGLLTPMRVDGQRLYPPKQELRLRLILTGRKLHLSLNAISAAIGSHVAERGDEPMTIFDTLDPSTVKERIRILEAQKAMLNDALTELRRAAEAWSVSGAMP